MPPPSAEPFAARVLLGPALRAQPDRRLVTLVREGYEAAFEEIVRRYGRPLDRFAAGFVGGRSEDVTQDALSKALLALRGSEAEIELRPWLYRIVRNTALNELRDRPPAAEQLAETIPGGLSAAAEAERREEMAELMARLGALPEPQRAAIVMRELEGLSHEEIAGALGVSGGAARQAIFRARAALRNGLGLLVPLPLVRILFDHGAEAAAGGAAATGVATAASGSAGATLSGIGAGGALKAGVAAALIAGTVGAGVAIQHDRGGDGAKAPGHSAAAVSGTDSSGRGSGTLASEGNRTSGEQGGRGSGSGHGGSGDGRSGHGSGDGGPSGSARSGDGPSSSGHGGPGPSGSSGSGGPSGSGRDGGGNGGHGTSGDGGSSGGSSGGGDGGSGSGDGGTSGGSGGGGDSLDGGGDSSGSGGSTTETTPTTPEEPTSDGVSGGGGGDGTSDSSLGGSGPS
jgi:RNA polymerase sigma factor (sigma-70 family)